VEKEMMFSPAAMAATHSSLAVVLSLIAVISELITSATLSKEVTKLS